VTTSKESSRTAGLGKGITLETNVRGAVMQCRGGTLLWKEERKGGLEAV